MKYRLAANITEYHITSKLIVQRIIITNFFGSESHLRYTNWNFEANIWISKSKKNIYSNRSINKKIGHLWSRESFEVNFNIGFGISIEFPSKKMFKSFHKQGNWTFVFQWVISGKVQYRIWNPHQISKSMKKNIEIGPEKTKLCFNQKCQNHHV